MTDCQGKETKKKKTKISYFKTLKLKLNRRDAVFGACRYDSSGDSGTDKALGRTSSYTRRETRLSALNRQDQDSPTKDYKKVELV